ncbi:MAG: hypothetical protein M3024_05365 [Candidatus Dormibacteraeota bacterium]|nr:hypothetical protein [Candidatus Dormibacteraeota bacterium]
MGLEWAFIIFAIFCAGQLVRGPRKAHAHHMRGLAAEPPRPPRRVRQAVPRMTDLTAGRLPVQYQVKVDTIRRKVEWMLTEHAASFPAGSEERHLVERTATDYLPETLASYYQLPPGYAHWPVRADGKTGLQVLWEQLDLMDRKLDEIARDVERRDVDRLLVNGRFLEQRFDRTRS